MRAHGLGAVAHLRRFAEHEARIALGSAVRAEAALRAAVPPPVPALGPGLLSGAQLSHDLLVIGLGEQHRERSVKLVDEASVATGAAREQWSDAARSARAVERLIERRQRERRVARAKKAQADLDEAALAGWRRNHVHD